MTTYKLKIEDRNYTDISTVDAYTLKPLPIPTMLDPIKEKLFNHDIIDIQSEQKTQQPYIRLLHSCVRSMQIVPGVLVLQNNKTFGKYKDKFLYKCIPDDKRLPIFVVPYKIKHTFSKAYKNKYIVFKFRSWETKHPLGQIVNVLGDVDSLDNFYEYQLYCKSLYASIQNITKKALKKLKQKTEEEYIETIIQTHKLQDHRKTRNIFSIDPEKSKDFDDAFSIEKMDEKTTRISIYISNVSFWMDILDLWSSFNCRITTIYLPDRKRPMLPTVLSDALCSLTEKDIRFAFVLELYVDNETSQLTRHEFHNAVIKVKRNLRYDTEEQENHHDYKQLLNIVRNINRKPLKYIDNIETSHDVVAYLMITMNYICAKELEGFKTGIFRSTLLRTPPTLPDNITPDIKKFVKHWNSFGSQYNKFENITGHEILDFDAYVHITSPIRRLVDLLNIMVLQEKLDLAPMSDSGRIFYNYWTSNNSLEYINTTMRSVRKVQNDCNLLALCTDNDELFREEFDGFVFDKIVRNDALYQYIVYLPKIKMVNRYTSRFNINNLSMQKFKIYLFHDEINLKKKIRLEQIVEL
jgi:exoribonuclease R